jgi:hypothetical protein
MQPHMSGILYMLWKYGEEGMSHCLILNFTWNVNMKVAMVITSLPQVSLTKKTMEQLKTADRWMFFLSLFLWQMKATHVRTEVDMSFFFGLYKSFI